MDIKNKICRFCAYQERSQQEVRNKLYEYGCGKEEVEQLISTLIEDNYLNEERFAKAYARGKFQMKKWGKRKILYQLKNKHKISDYCLQQALREIDDEMYLQSLRNLLLQKWEENHHLKSEYQRRQKTINYLIQKGYEVETSRNILQEIIAERRKN